MRNVALVLIILPLLISCSYFRSTTTVRDIVNTKTQMDAIDNPAQRLVIKRELMDKVIVITDATVKNIIESTNIDYDFCVIVDVPLDNRKVECYIYSKNIFNIAKLEKGKTKIDVKGDFSRFFTMLDDYYTKIEIINATIKIKDSE